MARRDPFNVKHPIFLPLWRRVALVGFCLGWALLELTLGKPLFGVLSGAAGLWCAYQFFVVFDPEAYRAAGKPDPSRTDPESEKQDGS